MVVMVKMATAKMATADIVQLDSGNDVVRSLFRPCQLGVAILFVCCPVEEPRILPAQGIVGWDQNPGCAMRLS